MRILGHIHTFNDESIIDQSLGALLAQTRPLDAILIVDNASQDGTLKRPFPEQVTVIRHAENLGTNGAAITGLRYALEHGYEWIWIFDADSAPRADALERLLELRDALAPETLARVSFLACLPLDNPDLEPRHGARFTASGVEIATPSEDRPFYACDVTIWSGCLYQLAAVREIGMPNPHYVLDWGEFEYGLQCQRKGYQGFIDARAVMVHNIKGHPATRVSRRRVGPFTIRVIELPPIRCYYQVRNWIYFWLYENRRRSLRTLVGGLARTALLTGNFLLRPWRRGAQIAACVRGIADGLTGRIERRF